MWGPYRYVATGSALRGDRRCTAGSMEEWCDVGSLSPHGDRIRTARR
jgi:hypothetical protein